MSRGVLEEEIKALIASEGPIGLERYMSLALGHPGLGYYVTRDPFGAAGDFVTAPEISQMFGELIGLWAAVVWNRMGSPTRLRLVELGPGRGTLMADAIRASRALPPFRAALDVHLVETSPVLRDVQRSSLEAFDVGPTWHDGLETLPAGPAIVLANEFFDALPVRHYIRTPQGWSERLVGLAGDALAFGLAPEPERSITLEAPQGAVLEVGLAARRLATQLAAHLAREGGVALILDYGYAAPAFGETLQALRAHRFVDPLDCPGEADLTAHVDFAALGRSARAAGASVYGPVPQGEFLESLGLTSRAAVLMKGADAAQASAIEAAVARLGGAGAPQRPGMGRLFKALAFGTAGLPAPPGFSVE